jgi:glycosidase
VKITSEPDEHFGTPEELRELTAEAHKHGIRILMDFVGNHVHQDAEIYKTYKNEGWFYSYFLCGYDEKPIECWFQPYLPDINYSVNDAVNTFTDSAIEWIEEADLDGFRVDAVKHMLHNFTRTLRAKIEEQIVGESGTDFYMVGETFVAQWDFTAQKTQGLIKQYINDWELDGQFNFPLYWEIIREIARNEDSFVKMAAVVEAYIAYFGEGAFLMSNFLGNHDIARFISHANNNILDMWSNGSKELGWSNPPALPSDSAPFKRLQVAFSVLMTIPGIPLIYYGDEIGMPGAGDPDNRRMMYFSGLNSDQNELKTHVGKVAIIRSNHKALRQGTLKNLVAETDIYAYLREDADDRVIIALNKASSQKFVEIPVSLIPFASAGDTFHDELSGADFKIAGGKLAFPLDPISSAILVKK